MGTVVDIRKQCLESTVKSGLTAEHNAMATKRKRKTEEYAFISVKVKTVEMALDAGINFHPYGWYPTGEDDLIYTFGSDLQITGECIYPLDRVGHEFLVILRGSSTPSDHLKLKLEDLHKLDQHGSPVYKKYKDGSRPVYNEPLGLTFVDKVRGENKWTVWLQTDRQMVSDSLVLASSGRQLYFTINEKKANRHRWVMNFSLSTTNPEEE